MFSIFFLIKMFSGTDESLRPARFPPLMRTQKRKSQYSTDTPGGKKACGTSTSSAGGTRTNNRPGHPTGLSMMNNPYNTCYANCALFVLRVAEVRTLETLSSLCDESFQL